ncbi:hypothetical protein BG005_002881 [Podila minutissima]|nr:hypothetical protein BG005_002881 [Podila minutissima]
MSPKAPTLKKGATKHAQKKKIIKPPLTHSKLPSKVAPSPLKDPATISEKSTSATPDQEPGEGTSNNTVPPMMLLDKIDKLWNLQDVIKVNAADSGPKAPVSSEVKCLLFNPSDEIHLAIKKLTGDTTIPLIKGSLTEIDFAALKHLTGDFTKGHPEPKFDTTRTCPCYMVVDIAITLSNFKTAWENFF